MSANTVPVSGIAAAAKKRYDALAARNLAGKPVALAAKAGRMTPEAFSTFLIDSAAKGLERFKADLLAAVRSGMASGLKSDDWKACFAALRDANPLAAAALRDALVENGVWDAPAPKGEGAALTPTQVANRVGKAFSAKAAHLSDADKKAAAAALVAKLQKEYGLA